MKVVINTCYGGFGLSLEAVKMYFKLKKTRVYPEKFILGSYIYYLQPKKSRPKINPPTFYENGMDRHDPDLVKVVEELGDKSWGRFSKLKVVEIPDNVVYEIEEYDGKEWVAEVHCTWS